MCYVLRYKNRNYLVAREDGSTLPLLRTVDYLINEKKTELTEEDKGFITSVVSRCLLNSENEFAPTIRKDSDFTEVGKGLLLAYEYDREKGLNYGIFD